MKITQQVLDQESGEFAIWTLYQAWKIALASHALFQDKARLAINSVIYSHKLPMGTTFAQGPLVGNSYLKLYIEI